MVVQVKAETNVLMALHIMKQSCKKQRFCDSIIWSEKPELGF